MKGRRSSASSVHSSRQIEHQTDIEHYRRERDAIGKMNTTIIVSSFFIKIIYFDENTARLTVFSSQ